MRVDLSHEIARFLIPDHQYSRREVLDRPSPVPAEGGVYGWWFRPPLPQDEPQINTSGCSCYQGLTLMYVGISPKRPPANGRLLGKRNLRLRLRQHYTRTAAASTLRRSLGCLLAEDLNLHLQPLGSGGRTNFGDGEQKLSDWMAANAFVSWLVREHPWELEDELIRELDLPLNLEGNQRNPFHATLTRIRARHLAEARQM